MTKKERLELNALSFTIFGRTSAWEKYMKKGEMTEMVEIMEDGTKRKYKGIKWPTLEDVKIRLDELLIEKAEKDAKKKADQEAEEKAKETSKEA